jgi:hypothetical protein
MIFYDCVKFVNYYGVSGYSWIILFGFVCNLKHNIVDNIIVNIKIVFMLMIFIIFYFYICICIYIEFKLY